MAKGPENMRKLILICLTVYMSVSYARADEVSDFIASDFDSNGVLVGDEYREFIKRRAKAGNASAKWVVTFSAWGRALKTVDTNGDGIVTPAELRAFDAKD